MDNELTVISTPATTRALARALGVMVLTPHIRAYLKDRDPKALLQADNALVLAGLAGWTSEGMRDREQEDRETAFERRWPVDAHDNKLAGGFIKETKG